MKTFSAFEKRAILNVAQSIRPLKSKIDTIDRKIVDLMAEKNLLSNQITSIEDTITPFTMGHSSSELVNTVAVAGGATKYTFKYPDTILPPEEENVENNNFNNDLLN